MRPIEPGPRTCAVTVAQVPADTGLGRGNACIAACVAIGPTSVVGLTLCAGNAAGSVEPETTT